MQQALLFRTSRLFVVVSVLLCPAAITGITAASATETVVHAFAGRDGATPAAGLIADQNGNLYGTTEGGGSCCGTVFEVKSGRKEQVLYAFRGGSDGQAPAASLLLDGSGNLLGTTSAGGGTGCLGGGGCGTIYDVAPDGKENVLYAFQGQGDGWNPRSNLVEDANGDLFGTTGDGGNYGGNCGTYGCGAVFELPAKGSLKTLYAFQGGSDGGNPAGGVILDSAGNLYGTAQGGSGTNCEGGGCGVVFKIASDGTYSVLYTFQGGTDGYMPAAGLTEDSAGIFYGTTSHGGTRDAGVVFKVTPSGAETVLYSFQSGTDGQNPQAGLVLDSAGNLYGTTWLGGGTGHGCKKLFGNGCGTVFKVAPGGQETVLNYFYKQHGQLPTAPVLLLNGALYGTTTEGGKHKDGVVFSVTP